MGFDVPELTTQGPQLPINQTVMDLFPWRFGSDLLQNFGSAAELEGFYNHRIDQAQPEIVHQQPGHGRISRHQPAP